jgi:DNA-binding XRE family transcriptional regulator
LAETRHDLRDTARKALERWLETHLADGDVPPKPSAELPRMPGRPPITVSVSPLLAVRLQIRWGRHERGLSQADLGDLLGVSRQQIALLEAPDGNPTIRTLQRAAQALGMELAIELRKPHAA